jgi:hypothetical protein
MIEPFLEFRGKFEVCSDGDTGPLKPALAEFPFFVLPRLL